ncbi:MAG: hypothetical protein AAGL99_10330 [Pseudomonadota bacterium]
MLRALQRGGVAAKTERDAWAVWRCHDRRRRIIGTLSGAQVDVLRLNDCLTFAPEKRAPRLVWNLDLSVGEPCQCLTALSHLDPARGRALDAFILSCSDPIERGRIVDLILSLQRTPQRWAAMRAKMATPDFELLEQLLAWPSTMGAFAMSKGLRPSTLERRMRPAFRVASAEFSNHP